MSEPYAVDETRDLIEQLDREVRMEFRGDFRYCRCGHVRADHGSDDRSFCLHDDCSRFDAP